MLPEAVMFTSALKYNKFMGPVPGATSFPQVIQTAATFNVSLFEAIGRVGFIVTSCLLNENHDFFRLAINTVRDDIIGRNETFQCLALTLVGNIGGREFAESLALDVQKLLISSSVRPLVRKKAALCLLRLYRKNPDVMNVDGW
ncbi:AP-2 complex subunit alpha-1-like [Henckelia pumila]|uniref:AP-2 complex subunit alpha-1-like n=1 Tax=Henckelia pumila TaxID=405737 RepID=UPI003C6E9DDA